MTLNNEQKQQFREQGFVQIHHAISTEMVERAQQTINWKMGQGIPADRLTTWSSQSFFPEIQNAPAITDLMNASGLLETLESVLGANTVTPARAGQIAIRFPREPGTPPQAPHPHIDGIYSPHNGVQKGTVGSFTALIGVLLSDLTRENAGNFCVWPGSHQKLNAHFQQHGTDELFAGQMPKIDLGTPHQIQGKAGDAVLCHYQLAHTAVPNVGPLPRYAIFFRVTHPNHNDDRAARLQDLWMDWPGIDA